MPAPSPGSLRAPTLASPGGRSPGRSPRSAFWRSTRSTRRPSMPGRSTPPGSTRAPTAAPPGKTRARSSGARRSPPSPSLSTPPSLPRSMPPSAPSSTTWAPSSPARAAAPVGSGPGAVSKGGRSWRSPRRRGGSALCRHRPRALHQLRQREELEAGGAQGAVRAGLRRRPGRGLRAAAGSGLRRDPRSRGVEERRWRALLCGLEPGPARDLGPGSRAQPGGCYRRSTCGARAGRSGAAATAAAASASPAGCRSSPPRAWPPTPTIPPSPTPVCTGISRRAPTAARPGRSKAGTSSATWRAGWSPSTPRIPPTSTSLGSRANSATRAAPPSGAPTLGRAGSACRRSVR